MKKIILSIFIMSSLLTGCMSGKPQLKEGQTVEITGNTLVDNGISNYISYVYLEDGMYTYETLKVYEGYMDGDDIVNNEEIVDHGTAATLAEVIDKTTKYTGMEYEVNVEGDDTTYTVNEFLDVYSNE